MVFIVHCWKPNLQSLLGTSRPFSSAAQSPKRLDPVDKLLHQTNGKAFALPIKGFNFELLHTPTDYFDHLLAGIHAAKRDITIASLYVGTAGGREEQFMHALASAVRKPAAERPRMVILLDALRSTRPSKDAQGTVTSSAQLLDEALLGQGGSNDAAVYLFHTPALRGLLKRVLPPRVSEVVGVCHLKAYIFDDSVLISGANLSNTYFGNRQDRYYLFRDAPLLASHIRSLVQVVGRYSYRLQPGARLEPNQAGLDPLAAPAAFNAGLRRDLERLFMPPAAQQSPLLDAPAAGAAPGSKASSGEPSPGLHPPAAAAACSAEQSGGGQGRATPEEGSRSAWPERGALLADALSGHVSSAVDPAHGRRTAQAVPDLQALHWRMPRLGGEPEQALPAAGASPGGGAGCAELGARAHDGADTWVLPTVQLGSAELRQDEALTLLLLRSAEPGGRLTVSTPYINLTDPYQRALASACQVDIELLTASPAANGFFGAGGVSGWIPAVYSLLEQAAWRRLTRLWARSAAAAGRARTPKRLLEYGRPGWEFHAKGIWYTPPGEALPVATAVGSSNFGYRSVVRDLEAGFLVVTRDPVLRQAMGAELERLRTHAEAVDEQHFRRPGRRATPTVRLAAHLLRSFL